MALALCAGASFPQVAQAATTTTTNTTTPGTSTISFAGTATDGTAVALGVQIEDVTLSRFWPADPSASPGGPGSDYLTFEMEPDESAGTDPTFQGFNGVPLDDISLVLADGKTVPAVPPSPQLGFLDGSYAFVVPADTATATIEVAAVSVSAVESSGTTGSDAGFTQIAFQASSAPIVVPPPPVAVTVPPTTTQPTSRKTVKTPLTKMALAKKATTHGSTALPVGAGAGGGIVVLVLFIPIWRRRAYKKADSEGRVIVDSPPLPGTPNEPTSTDPVLEAEQTTGSQGAGVLALARIGAVDVRVLGPLEIHGVLRPVRLLPVRELLVFLALHRGQSFTTIELRNAIWVEGRTEPKPETFHNYLSDLRRSLPTGVLAKAGYHFALTDAVTSDLSRFETYLEGYDDRAERFGAALALVRGSPFEGEFSGRTSPYSWATDLCHQIEVAVEKAGHELCVLSLEAGDPVQADAAVAQVLNCVPASIVAREDYLRVGSVLGGPRELDRRLRAARTVMGDDARLLEPVAHGLGWVES
jgi:hypothetical protein